MSRNFVPLRIITGYSFLHSGLTMERVSASIKKNDYYGAALADYNFLYGVPSFIEEMEKLNKPYLIGLSVALDDDLVIYALNEKGYRNLIQISALCSENQITELELSKYLEGTAMVLETNHGLFKKSFAEGLDDHYLHYLAKLSTYSDIFYLGIEVTNKAEFATANKIREFAKSHSYETIAFPRIEYQNSEDKIILTIVNAIENNEKIEVKEEKGQNFFNAFEAYQKLYLKEELDKTIDLVNKSTFKYHQVRGELLHFPCENAKELLKNKVFTSLKEKGIDDESHRERANYELEIISDMGYNDYFLIVGDYVEYAKSAGILVGPGRGSAAGSLVSYCLNITEVDPLEYDLSFERFLNKARKSMPDIDVDFMDTRREEMVQYMRDKYGANRVSNITTFQTIKAKQALRDIGRVYNIPTHYIDMLSKAIPDRDSLREAYKKHPTFRNLVDSDKYFLEIVALASKIENLPRQPGLHPAGIIINEKPIQNALPVTVDFDNNLTSQFEKDYIEEQGFLKMDFLALITLTTIDSCIKLINQRHNKNLSFYDIPYKDPNIFPLIAKTMTAGLFQIESEGMQNAIKIIEPKCFDDVAALIALFRPGPMDNIREYKDRMSGKIKPKYLSSDIEKVLKSTYGILVYQEQISQIATVMAGFSNTDADLFRRAVSHKEKSVLESAKKDFVSGSVKKGYSQKDSELMFNDILKFANYGFNKSHAIVYAITACRMAYLKYYYPLEFYISILGSSSGPKDMKFTRYLSEMKKRNLLVNGPDINNSDMNFSIKDDGLIFPLQLIKGVDTKTASRIIDNRLMYGPYKDFFDFVKRMFKDGATENVIGKLIDAGCFDSLYPSRSSLRSTIKYALQLSELSYGVDGQLILDETLENQKRYFEEKDDPLDNLNHEYEVLGLMLSDNPLRYKKDVLDKLHTVSLIDAPYTEGDVVVCGIISTVKKIKTRKTGSTMAFISIFDEDSELEVTVFSRLYNEIYTLLEKNNIVTVKGHYDRSNPDKQSFVADEIKLLEEEIND